MGRRAHRKSRRGCFSCKQRRIKCDEQKPSCHKCLLRDEACIYPSSSLKWIGDKSISSESVDTSTTLTSSPSSLPQFQNTSIPENPSLNLENIDLIINWFTKTVFTVNSTANPRALEVCQTVILDQAMKHHFLLHGLLALSALHLTDSQLDHKQKEKYIQIAISHHTRGISLYHAVLADINEGNSAASIAFSSLTIMFEFARGRPVAGQVEGIEVVDCLRRIFYLGKGWHGVVGVVDEIRGGKTPGSSGSLDEHLTPLRPDFEAGFQRLIALNNGENKEVYDLALASLKEVFKALEKNGEHDPHVALMWANSCPVEFLRLLESRENLALVILGYYCLVLDGVPQMWWLKGWGKGLFDIIWMLVDLQGRNVLEWPRERLRGVGQGE